VVHFQNMAFEAGSFVGVALVGFGVGLKAMRRLGGR
jgi:hypothetical protein